MARKASSGSTSVGDKRLYTLQVFIISGPITEEFAQENEVVARTIKIRGDQTLEDLHNAIFEALDREEEHMYEFQIGGKGPQDPRARCYVLPMALDSSDPAHRRGGDLTQMAVGSLGLEVDQAFGYWFDFGDDWLHQINVVAIDGEIPAGKYPKVTERIGVSPPQYADWDEEEEDDEDEEDNEDEEDDDNEEDDENGEDNENEEDEA